MGSFDVRFETKNSQGSSFSMMLSLREHSLSLGQFVVYPRVDRHELIFMPKFKFRCLENRFKELYAKNLQVEKEKDENVKSKNRKYFISKEEIRELHKLRSIISNARCFNITGYDTEVILPSRFLAMLDIADIDFLTFIPTGRCEFVIINPADAWMYSPHVYSEYSDENDPPNNFINRIRRVI